jgi:hypothetical protein
MKGIIFMTGGISLRKKLNRDNLPSPFFNIIYEFRNNMVAQASGLSANILLPHLQGLLLHSYTWSPGRITMARLPFRDFLLFLFLSTATSFLELLAPPRLLGPRHCGSTRIL